MSNSFKSRLVRFLYILVLVVILFISGKFVIKSVEIVSSSEGKQMVNAQVGEVIENTFQYMINEIFALVGVSGQDNTENIIDRSGNLVTNELLPILVYMKDYTALGNELVLEQELVPKYFYEDEETLEIEQASSTVEEIEVDTENTEDKAIQEEENGITYTMKELKDFEFLKNHFYIVESTTTITAKELDADKLLSKDMTIDISGNEPKVLIYHTHAASEWFADSDTKNIEDSVVGLGNLLTKILEEDYGIKVYHDTTKYDLIDGSIDRNKAYTVAGESVEKILEENPSIEVVIDLHRDGVNDDVYFATEIDGKKTAKIMFMNGMSRTAKNGDIAYLKNPYKEDNLAFSLQLQLEATKIYEDFVRKIYIKGYRYNMHFKPKSILVEVGAQTNTVEEVKNAMYPLARILNAVLVSE